MDTRTLLTRFESDGQVSLELAWQRLVGLGLAGLVAGAIVGLLFCSSYDLAPSLAVLPGLAFVTALSVDAAPWVVGPGNALLIDADGLLLRRRRPVRIRWAHVREMRIRTLGRNELGGGGRRFIEIHWREGADDRRVLLPRIFDAPYDELVELLTARLRLDGPRPGRE